MFNDAEHILDRLAEIRNDIGAVDRTLNVLGYSGKLDATRPRQKRKRVMIEKSPALFVQDRG